MNAPPRLADAALAALAREAGLSGELATDLRAVGRAFEQRPFRFSTPGFRHFDSDELPGCGGKAAFPAFSITAGACALQCKHCRADVLKPMLPAGHPATFEARVRTMIERQGLSGFLLSGGSNRRNEVAFEPYLPAVRRLKNDHPSLRVLAHTGLVDARRAQALKQAGVDVAMLDIIGDDDTIREVYHLDRPVAHFDAALAHLVAAGLTVVPHVVVGLHFGRMRGEKRALDIIARHRTEAAILVVLMHAFADENFVAVDVQDAARLFARARTTLADRQVLLGCARPHGAARVALDIAAVLAGFDGIAYPSDEAVRAVRLLGRAHDRANACCGAQACAEAA